MLLGNPITYNPSNNAYRTLNPKPLNGALPACASVRVETPKPRKRTLVSVSFTRTLVEPDFKYC